MPRTQIRKPLFVAVVDDHRPFRTALCRILEKRGYAARGFGSVPEFIKAQIMSALDCLILDIAMPDFDGLTFQECLRHTKYTFPIIICTGQNVDDLLENARAKGASRVLQKPVNSVALFEAIESACKAPGAK